MFLITSISNGKYSKCIQLQYLSLNYMHIALKVQIYMQLNIHVYYIVLGDLCIGLSIDHFKTEVSPD